MQKEIKKISFKGQKIFVGLDTHLRSWKVTIMLEQSIFKTFSMNPKVEELASYLRKHFPGGTYYSAYEASFCGFSIHRELVANGIKNIIVNPADIPTTDKERKQKEDKRDSRKIARSLRNGDLKAIYVPTNATVEFRGYVRYRKTLVKEITRNKNRVKSLLYFSGIEIPEALNSASSYWSGKFTQWLAGLEFETEYGKMVLDNLVDLTQRLRKDLLVANRSLRKLYFEGEYSSILQLLTTIPGIGLITAVTLLSEIENIKRFKSLDQLCSFVGLIPSTSSSGDTDKIGSITPRKNKLLRSIIIECSWMAIRADPSLALSFNELSKRMTNNKAIIRIAKKLLNRIRFVMQNETEYVCGVV
jgi:transposase